LTDPVVVSSVMPFVGGVSDTGATTRSPSSPDAIDCVVVQHAREDGCPVLDEPSPIIHGVGWV
jgi:hypothetical protein